MSHRVPWDHFAIRRLIFRWPERNVSFVFPLLFLASVAVHALTFYVFQVVYPPTPALAPTPGQVTLLSPGPESEALLKWVDAQDPAAACLQEITPPGLGEVRYIPSYSREQSLPKLEEPPGPTVFPPARDPLAPLAKVASATPPHRAVRTSLSFSESLRGRDAAPGEAVKLNRKSAVGLHPTEFLTAVDDRGELRFCFLQAGCGDREIDLQAEAILRSHPFRHTDTPAPLVWGFATFVWGNEAFSPSTPESAGTVKP